MVEHGIGARGADLAGIVQRNPQKVPNVPRQGFAHISENPGSSASGGFQTLNADQMQGNQSPWFHTLAKTPQADARGAFPAGERSAAPVRRTGHDQKGVKDAEGHDGPQQAVSPPQATDRKEKAGRSLAERLRDSEVDEDAWRVFVQGSTGKLLAQARRRGDPRDAEDTVQIALMRTFDKRRGVDNAQAYATRAVGSVTVDNAHSSRNREASTDFQDNPAADRPSHGIDLDERIDVRDAMDRLSERHRDVIDLLYFRDLTRAQAAGILGISPEAVKSAKARALQALRKQLGAYA